MTATIIDGRAIAKQIRKDVAKEVAQLTKRYGITPKIATIKIGKDPSSDLYLKLRDKACHEVGITSHHLEFSRDVIEDKVLQAIQELNNDHTVHGILIQFPIPDHLSSNTFMNAIDPNKDVEGLTPHNMGRTLIGDEHLIPCTPLAVLTILEYEKISLKGKNMVVINHSNIVGKPLAALLLNRNATVTVCNVFTKDIKPHTSTSDILITATGIPRLITVDHVKNNAVVIDIGIVPTKDGICGDVDFDAVKEKAGKLTPVPGGVGPVTVACSLKNMVKTYKNGVEDKKR